MSIGTRLFKRRDFKGDSAHVAFKDPKKIYMRLPKSFLENQKVHDNISSLRFKCTEDEMHGSYLYIFQHHKYNGRYQAFRCSANRTIEIPRVDSSIEDETTTAVVIRRQAMEHSVELAELLRNDIEEEILKISDVKLRGEPIFTWDPWPSVFPERVYMQLRIPTKINVPIAGFRDREAELRYWFYFVVNKHKIDGQIDWVQANVLKPKAFKGRIQKKIKNRMIENLPEFKTKLREKLVAVNGLLAATNRLPTRLYLLPGNKPSGDSWTGQTTDNVTLVISSMPIVRRAS